jgi:DNA-binding GntR family transcriptional regulator
MKIQRYKSTAEFVTAEIRRMILSGDLEPGARLDQEEVAKLLDVSRHPVRQAIERLAERGFVVLEPHKSAVVAEISLDDMRQLYQARNELEVLAVREGWPRFSSDLPRRLNELLSRMLAVGTSDLDEFMIANRDFHLSLYRECANRYLFGTIERLFDLSERYQRTGHKHSDRSRQSMLDHREIIAAVEKHDLERLVDVVRAHNAGGLAAAAHFLDDSPTPVPRPRSQ